MMLRLRNIEVQCRGARVDVIGDMHIDRLQPPETAQDSAPAAPRPLTVPELAHELNSLLDGSLRFLGIAGSAAYPGLDPEALEELHHRLACARGGLMNMATVLRRAMTADESGAQLLRRDDTLGLVVAEVLESLHPLAEEAGVSVTVDIHTGARDLRAGALGSVLANGIRNAIEACKRSAVGIRCVEVVVDCRTRHDELELIITDSGPGLDEDAGAPTIHGHGLGLAVCREIVDELGGRLTLTNVPFSRGAVMQVHVPIGSLRL